ncbi:S-layer protein [Undibacterium sp.]|uniref:S-layer protein n=1 Tax=Undibacterium sp. TaxID=1914977 RepID=UPI002730C4DF|nr:S-layer protein [Undibacterium sp.]MDP1977374.1 S-layer protein [Undibacterium sp.]
MRPRYLSLIAISFVIPSTVFLLHGCGSSSDSTAQAQKPDLPATSAAGWTTGDLHVHTIQSDDARTTQTLDTVLDKAFTSYGLDWTAITNHLRSSKYDHNGAPLTNPVPFAYGMASYEIPRIKALQASGRYADKTIFSGFEWDMPTHDHLGVSIFDVVDGKLISSTSAAKEFQYLFTTLEDSKFDAADVSKWKAKYPQRFNSTAADALQAISWLKKNYPDTSFITINHPSRNPGKYTIADFRTMNDMAPNIMFSIEGMVGNQMEPDRGGYTSSYTDANKPNRVYGGVDSIVAQVGGVWDALLGEGRRIWNIADSDSHFKIDDAGNSSGYFPGEYAKNYVWMNDKKAGVNELIKSLQSGRMFSVFGDLINAMEFTVSNVNNASDVKNMGQELKVANGSTVDVNIRFKSPARNNYEFPLGSGVSANKAPKVDHVDLIVGDVGRKAAPDSSAYNVASNPSTKVLKRFTSADWRTDAEGYYVIKYQMVVQKNQYLRLRGTNLGINVADMTENGEPLADAKITTTDNPTRHNQINDRNYASLWFYSNPVFVSVN